MHELGIVFHAIKMIEDICEENQLSEVTSVTMEFGEVSGVIPEYLQDCWKWAASKRDWLAGATLDVQQIDAVTVCNDCGRTYGTVKHGRTCPHCGSEHTELLRGTEFEIRDVTAM